MKKLGIFAAAISTAAAGIIAQSASAIPGTIYIKDDNLYEALKTNASFYFMPYGSTTYTKYTPGFIDKGGVTPISSGEPSSYGAIVDEIIPDKIVFDCSNGDPLANVESLDSLLDINLDEVGVCSDTAATAIRTAYANLDPQPSTNLNVFVNTGCTLTTRFINTQGEKLAEDDVYVSKCENIQQDEVHEIKTFDNAKYKLVAGDFIGEPSAFVYYLNNTEGESSRAVFRSSQDTENDEELFSDYFDMQPMGTWNDQTNKTIIYTYDLNFKIPTGDYTYESGESTSSADVKLIDANGNETEYTLQDVEDIAEALMGDEEASIEVVNGDITIRINGVKYLSVKPATTPEAAPEEETPANPNTADSFSTTLVVTLAASVMLGLGIATKARRR